MMPQAAVVLLPHPNDSALPLPQRRYLIIRRAMGVLAPNTLCFPGGKLEPRESAAQAAVRECREELGVEITAEREIWQSITPWQVELHWLLAQICPPTNSPSSAQEKDSPTVPLLGNLAESEVSAVYWLTCAELLAHPDALVSNRPFLEGVLSGEIPLT